MKQLLCAICAFFIYTSHANAISVDYSVNGTNLSYYDFNGDKSGILYLITPGSWGVKFPYGDVYGIASCNDTSGNGTAGQYTPTAPASNMHQTADGKNCWCRLIQIMGENITNAPWVFSYAYGSAAVCAGNCASDCGGSVHDGSDFRSGVFGSAGIDDIDNTEPVNPPAQPDPPAPQQQACDSDNDCTGSNMPRNAASAVCIQRSGNERACAAKQCNNGYYLVFNNGNSMGWCVAKPKCPSGEEPAIEKRNHRSISGVDTINQNAGGTKKFCKPVATASQPGTPLGNTDTPGEPETPDTRNNCDKGISGWVMFENNCITESEKSRIESERNASAERIKASVARVKNTLGSMKLSAWKTTEGKFNTARLASDSIAGIVLGTAGGLITSSLVKKSQIKKGFEDIQCAIGGQSVANYGDEFTVGVQ